MKEFKAGSMTKVERKIEKGDDETGGVKNKVADKKHTVFCVDFSWKSKMLWSEAMTRIIKCINLCGEKDGGKLDRYKFAEAVGPQKGRIAFVSLKSAVKFMTAMTDMKSDGASLEKSCVCAFMCEEQKMHLDGVEKPICNKEHSCKHSCGHDDRGKTVGKKADKKDDEKVEDVDASSCQSCIGSFGEIKFFLKIEKPVFIKLVNVPEVMTVKEAFLQKCFVEQYGEEAFVKIVKARCVENSTNGDLVVMVPIITYAAMLKKDLVFTMGFFSSSWKFDVKVDFCGHCYRWGHPIRSCKQKKRCVGGCDTFCPAKCSSKSKTCLNCDGRHFPWSRKCGERKALVQKGLDAVASALEALEATASA